MVLKRKNNSSEKVIWNSTLCIKKSSCKVHFNAPFLDELLWSNNNVIKEVKNELFINK